MFMNTFKNYKTDINNNEFELQIIEDNIEENKYQKKD